MRLLLGTESNNCIDPKSENRIRSRIMVIWYRYIVHRCLESLTTLFVDIFSAFFLGPFYMYVNFTHLSNFFRIFLNTVDMQQLAIFMDIDDSLFLLYRLRIKYSELNLFRMSLIYL
jgi:hypothetical protein